MHIALKEMKKSKVRFLILGSIIFLISLLTFIISGLANGLSQDNAALIKDLPAGQFYMNEDAEETYNLSKIDEKTQQQLLKDEKDAVAFSIQMGFLNDRKDKQLSVAFVTSTQSSLFENVQQGEVVLDRSFKEKGVKIGDTLTHPQLDGTLTVAAFTTQKKFSHSPVAFIHLKDYQHMYRQQQLQTIFVPGQKSAAHYDGLQAFSNKEFLTAIPSYKAEQTSLNMIIWFLVIISGMLFAIFFYMMNVQKIGLYGILKALGMKTGKLFNMIWTQMLWITTMAIVLSGACSQLFNLLAPEGMPFHLTMTMTLQLAIVFLVVGFVGATLSGVQIKKINPLQAIQQGEM